MTDKAVQYYLDKDKLIDIRVDHWDNGKMYVSFYNDRNDTCVAYTCSREELKGLEIDLNIVLKCYLKKIWNF